MSSLPEKADKYIKTVTLKDGSQAIVRQIRGGDERALLSMFASLSPETVYNRFFKLRRPFTLEEVSKMVYIKAEEEFALVASPTTPSELSIIADARYFVEDNIRAEISIVVQDKWQLKGLGTAMLNYLINIGKENGIREYFVYVLSDNAVMIHVAKKLGFTLRSQSYGISRLDLKVE
ncbi:MAG: GNAT family N-acetyltransferase [Nitrososphaeria archaeon]